MYFEESIICDNIYIGDEIADPCKIIVTGNGGLCKIPHFDLVGGDLYCCISILNAAFLMNPEMRIPGKFTLTKEERENLNNILDQPNKVYTQLTNWQTICKDWNDVLPYNDPKIELEYYMDLSNKPNYAIKNIYFIDNGLYSRIYDNGDYKLRPGGTIIKRR